MELLLARQPVFDAHDRLVGYALAHSTPNASSSGRLLVEATLGAGLDTLIDRQRLYLPADAELLLSDTPQLLPADRTTFLISAREVGNGPEIASACAKLAWAGYRIALVDVEEDVAALPLARLADAVVVDVRRYSPEELAALAESLKPLHVRLIATGVRHRQERDRCARLGFAFFFGHRASRPETVARRDLPVQHLQAFRLLRLARESTTSDKELESMLQRDVTLSYKLLRMVNAASTGARDVWSIGHAMRLLGRATLVRWLGLLLLTDVATDERGAEVARVATTRARLCQLLAAESGIPRAGESLYLVGLLSLVDELLEVSAEQVVQLLQLAPDVRDALLHRAEFHGEVLALVEAFELGDWSTVDALSAAVGVVPSRVAALYLEALSWTREQQAARG